MYMIKISQDKAMDLSHNIEKMLRYGGMAMTCVSEMLRENGMDERMNYPPQYPPQFRENAGNYLYPTSSNMMYPEHPMYREDDRWSEPQMRQGVKYTGPYGMPRR